MSKIDLSQAKIGDKFRTRDGSVVEYVDYDKSLDLYIVSSENDKPYPVQKDGRFLCERESFSDLIKQVLDKPLDTIERDMRINHEMEKVVEVAKKEKQELQRRQEVVELADRIFFSERGSAYSFKDCIEVAEHSVNMINQYLKEGKL